jgi:choline kinase
MGKRLESDIPKCLYSFNGKTLIERNIDLGMSDSSLLPIPAASITA